MKLVDFQGHLAGAEKCGTFIINLFFVQIKTINPNKVITYVIVFDGDSNVQLGSGKIKIHYPMLIAMCGVERNVSLFFNNISKILIFNKI